jgi:predicted small secreted protein
MDLGESCMKTRYFTLLRLFMVSLFMTLSLVLGACDTEEGIGEDEGIGIEEGIGEEGELDDD